MFATGMGNYSAVSQSKTLNVLAEIGFDASRGAVSGEVGANIAYAINPTPGGPPQTLKGMAYGALGGAYNAAFKNIYHGAPLQVPDKPGLREALDAFYSEAGVTSRPINRSGGLVGLFNNDRGLNWGRINYILDETDLGTWLHESVHFAQCIKMGWINQSQAILSQRSQYGSYLVYKTPGTLEWIAQSLENIYKQQYRF